MPTKKTELELMQEVIDKLAAEGVEAFIEPRSSDDDEHHEVVLRVPAWEANDQLSRKAVYEFIHTKLASNPAKGFVANGKDYRDIYCYDPSVADEGKELDCWDLMVWTGGDTTPFDYRELVIGDDSAWDDGWEVSFEGSKNQRLANLWLVVHYEIIDLPAVPALSEPMLIELLQLRGMGAELFCFGPDLNDRWHLRLSDGRLVLHKASDNSLTPITQDNFDDKGRLVMDGKVLMHSTWHI